MEFVRNELESNMSDGISLTPDSGSAAYMRELLSQFCCMFRCFGNRSILLVALV